jgi:acetolactate synthase small subunit
MRHDRLITDLTPPNSPMTSPTNEPSNSAAFMTVGFSIHADADPGVMPRLLELFAKRSLIPSRWHSDLEDPTGSAPTLTIDLQVSGLNHQQINHVAASMRSMVSVISVLTYEKFDV